MTKIQCRFLHTDIAFYFAPVMLSDVHITINCWAIFYTFWFFIFTWCIGIQFPATYNKVPDFLGAMSVVICFAAAILSLALSMLIVPRQIMPWTGLLLVYEWTFTIFFILFGSYLHVIHQWGKHVANRTSSVSSNTASYDYDSGKGIGLAEKYLVYSARISIWLEL